MLSRKCAWLEWIGKPVLVLLNQIGRPRPAAEEQADLQRWRSHLGGVRCVRAVLAFDAFARCWVQEPCCSQTRRCGCRGQARGVRAAQRAVAAPGGAKIFGASLHLLAERRARAALDREPVAGGGLTEKVRELAPRSAFAARRRTIPGSARCAHSPSGSDRDVRANSDRPDRAAWSGRPRHCRDS